MVSKALPPQNNQKPGINKLHITRMIFGIGVDIVQKSRIQNQLEKYGSEFAERLLCQQEMAEYLQAIDKTGYMSNHIATKEAASKALGTGFTDGIRFRDICVSHKNSEKPLLTFCGEASKYIEANAITSTYLSISDEKDYSLALVILAIA